MLLVLRGATQLARHKNVLDNSECVWSRRAAHNSDEVRNPFAERRSARTTVRRFVRGFPPAESSEDQWPGKQASSRPDVVFPE